MERINYKVKIPSEIIVRGNKFIENHPGVEIEAYLRAQVVLYSTISSNFFGADLDKDEDAGKEMLFSFNLSLEKYLKSIIDVQGVSKGTYIREACIQVDEEFRLGKEDTIQRLNLALKSM